MLSAPTKETNLTYRAAIQPEGVEAAALSDGEALVYRRPGRYRPSDRLAGLAAAEFGYLDTRSAVFAVE